MDADRFGPGVIAADGSLDRAALGAVIFQDPEARLALNGITHPAIRRESSRLFAEAEHRDPAAVVVYDVPLLVEFSLYDDQKFRSWPHYCRTSSLQIWQNARQQPNGR